MTKLVSLHGRTVAVVGEPRRIAGGSVILVERLEDSEDMMLADGSVHPAHRKGYRWEEPVCNLRDL